MKKLFVLLFVGFVFLIGTSSTFADEKANGSVGGSNSSEEVSCKEFRDLTRDAWFIIRVAAPVLLIIYGAIDFGKAVMASEEKEIKKSVDTFIKRLVICIALFLLPTIVDLVVGIAGYGSVTACL